MKASAASSTATWRPDSPVSSAPRPERFSLDGPSVRLDPRTHAYRNDVADVALAGILFAPHYAAPVACGVADASVMVRAEPADTARAVSQLLHGERFHVIDSLGDWAWGYCGHDHYVGYLPSAALAIATVSTHRVVAITAPLFGGPSIKAAVRDHLPIGSLVAGEVSGDFLATAGGFVHHRHVRPIGAVASDPVAVAERLVGQPYLWGGRGAGGIDCSGLVQLASSFGGIAAPRDSDMQRESVGTPIAEDDTLRRGDLIFFPGHVGLMADETMMIHANAHWMAVTIEPLADVVARRDAPQPILVRKRLA